MPKDWTYLSLNHFPLKKVFFVVLCYLIFGVNLGWGQEYCVPGITTTVEPITSVILEDINNQNSASTNSPGYENFTAQSTNLVLGESYSIRLKGNTNGPDTHYFAVYIDFNGNGILDDPGEVFQIGSIHNSTGTDDIEISNTIIIPPQDASITPGLKRMRIIKEWIVEPSDPCSSLDYGQIEDYTVNLIPPCTEPIYVTTNNNLICAEGQEVILSASGGEPGTVFFQGTNSDRENTIQEPPVIITEPDTYYFRSQNNIDNCWGNPASITILEKLGPTEVDAGENQIIVCGSSVQFNGSANIPSLNSVVFEAKDAEDFQEWEAAYTTPSSPWNKNHSTNNANGTSPEIKYRYRGSPNEDVDNWIESPLINGINHNQDLELSFKQSLNYYNNYPFKIQVEISINPDSQDWIPYYSDIPTSDIYPETQTLNISDFAGELFYIRFRLTGQDFGMREWYIDDIKITGTGIPDSELIYSWTGPNEFESNEQNPIINNPGSEASGTYVLTVQYGVCSISDSVEVIVENCQEEAFINPKLRNRGQ